MVEYVEQDEGDSISDYVTELRSALDRRPFVVGVGRVAANPRELQEFWNDVTDELGECIDFDETRSGSHTGRKWMEIRYEPGTENYYRYSKNAQPLHTDGSYLPDEVAPDVVFFFCINQAPSGGETLFLEGPDLVHILKEKDPELLARLTTEVVKFSKAEHAKSRPIIQEASPGRWRFTWNYHCLDPSSPPEHFDLVERFHAFLQAHVVDCDSIHPVLLQPGQCVFFRDEEVLHGRRSYEAEKADDRFFLKGALRSR